MKRVFKKIIIWAAVFGFLVLAVRWFINQGPKGPDYSQTIPIQGANHIEVGSAHPVYNSNPPTSGWHYKDPAAIGFYPNGLPDEQLIHNLEHGEIWVSYHSRVPAETVKELEKLAGGFAIVTKREANDKDIAVAAWGRLDKFNIDEVPNYLQRINDFILRYQNQGPEKVRM